MKTSDKSSWKEAEKGLDKIADTLGRNRPAREIEPDEITDLIRPIYDRAKRSMADHVRSYIRSAYSWGLKSEHDYCSASHPHALIVAHADERDLELQTRRLLRKPSAGSGHTAV